MINFQNIDTVDTFENSKGILAITYDPKINLLAYPDKASGYVKLKNYEKNETILINAHNTKIACLNISKDGRYLSTASEKGRVIRIFAADDGAFLNEFNRGKEIADIYIFSFDHSTNFLSCSASTGTIHIFSLKSTHKKYEDKNKEK
jgi:WD40 repeat protein